MVLTGGDKFHCVEIDLTQKKWGAKWTSILRERQKKAQRNA